MSQNTLQVSKKLKAMVSELKELREVRRDFEKLLQTLHDLGLSAKTTLRRAHKSTPDTNKGGQRYRSTNKELLDQYKLLAKKIPAQWSTREEICKSAGLDPKAVDVPFMWLVQGGKDENKKVMKPILQGNGRRGLGGAYKKL
jgi:hypothetical protein